MSDDKLMALRHLANSKLYFWKECSKKTIGFKTIYRTKNITNGCAGQILLSFFVQKRTKFVIKNFLGEPSVISSRVFY